MTDFGDDIDPVHRKRSVQREHQLQAKGVVPWATKAALDGLFTFMAFDSAGKKSDDQRIFTAARGITKATPDTVLCLPNRMPIWVELKWGYAKPDDDQLALHGRLRALGHYVGVAWSVVDVFERWRDAGVEMRPGALVAAQIYDGKVAAVLARLDGNGPRKKSRAARPEPRFTAGKRMVRRAARGGVLF
jgi:hypothetical protein